jgi:periplasmic protein TonB
MVLIQHHPYAQTLALKQAIAGVQPVRVLGMAGAIALNVAAFMLLLVPVSAPMQVVEDKDPDVIFVEEKIKPPTPPPVEVPVVKPTTVRSTTPVPLTPPTPQPIQNQDVIVPDGTEYAPPTNPIPDVVATLPTNPDPLPSTRLEYASAPAPAYPREELLDGKEGTVVLRVLVDVDGKPLSVEIERSSGHRKLDEAARRQVLRKWMFRPAIRDGQAVQVYGIVPVSFSLSRQ